MDNPKIEEKIPPEAVVIFIGESDHALTKYNLSLAETSRREGRPIVKVRIKGLAPETTRLLKPKLEFASA